MKYVKPNKEMSGNIAKCSTNSRWPWLNVTVITTLQVFPFIANVRNHMHSRCGQFLPYSTKRLWRETSVNLANPEKFSKVLPTQIYSDK